MKKVDFSIIRYIMIMLLFPKPVLKTNIKIIYKQNRRIKIGFHPG